MKVLMIHNFYVNRGGEGQSALKEKWLLEKNGHTVIWYTKDNRRISGYPRLRRWFLFFTFLYSRSTYKDIRRIAREERPDVAHIHNIWLLISPSVYYALKRSSVPIVQSVHNFRYFCINGLALNNRGEICEKCAGLKLRHAVFGRCYHHSLLQSLIIAGVLLIHRRLGTFRKIDRFVFPSRFLRDKLTACGIPAQKSVVKANFVDLDALCPSQDGEDYAVFMGRIAPEKGLAALIEATSGIPGLQLRIIGDGPQRSELESMVQEREMEDRVQFLGYFREDSRFDIVKRARCLVFPSECYENQPHAILESLALGVPVIASRIGGNPELIQDGENGSLFEPGNPADLREKITGLLAGLQDLSTMRRQCRKGLMNRHDEQHAYQELVKVYEDVL
ncbi:glycosyltransferase family 4 protein [Acidobacteriota bacterium]